jgi:hypothetical protein
VDEFAEYRVLLPMLRAGSRSDAVSVTGDALARRKSN